LLRQWAIARPEIATTPHLTQISLNEWIDTKMVHFYVVFKTAPQILGIQI